MRSVLPPLLFCMSVACGDGGSPDAGRDGGVMAIDAPGTVDAGPTDAMTGDSGGASDGGELDGGAVDAGPTDAGPPETCSEEMPCSRSADRCALELGMCGGEGICVARPPSCSDPGMFGTIDPVCGCDAMTYPNECEAALVGVSAYDDEPCPDGSCRVGDCASGEFCFVMAGCDSVGMCVPIPSGLICPAVIDPVCGCDGMTYQNSCRAALAGASIDHDGACAIST